MILTNVPFLWALLCCAHSQEGLGSNYEKVVSIYSDNLVYPSAMLFVGQFPPV